MDTSWKMSQNMPLIFCCYTYISENSDNNKFQSFIKAISIFCFYIQGRSNLLLQERWGLLYCGPLESRKVKSYVKFEGFYKLISKSPFYNHFLHRISNFQNVYLFFIIFLHSNSFLLQKYNLWSISDPLGLLHENFLINLSYLKNLHRHKNVKKKPKRYFRIGHCFW